MGKSRFTTTDVAAEAACLRARLIGMRCANVYDAADGKAILLRLARSGDDGEKVGVLLEPGVRFHTVPDDAADRGKGDGGGGGGGAPPSGLAMKLRKHLRSRRLEAVTQLGCDRLVDFVFGSGDGTHHLVLELHSHGNLVLADAAWTVLSLQRSHVDAARGLAILPAKPYPLAAAVRPRARLTADGLAAALAGAGAGRGGGGRRGDAAAAATAAKQARATTLKAAVAAALPHGPAVAEHVILRAGLAPGRVVAAAPAGDGAATVVDPLSPAEVGAIVAAAGEVETWIDGCHAVTGGGGGGEDGGGPAPAATPLPSCPPPPAGTITLSHPPPAAASPAPPPPDAPPPPPSYDSFEALPLAQHAARQALPFPTFDAAVSEFFGAVAGQRAAAAQAAAEAAALARVDRIKADQARRAGELEAEAAAAEAAARALEANLAAADEALAALRGALARGLAWPAVERLIADEAAAGNPVAGRIVGLRLAAGKATLALPRPVDEGEEGGAAPLVSVEVDVALGAHANARSLYEARRARLTKHARTLAGHEAALAAAAARAATTVESVRAAAAARAAARAFKPLWFQRFDWFITSEGFLVLAGRDAAQNEALVRRHLRPGDAFVHADVHGAAAVILKNRRGKGVPLPPLSLAEAGAACVCRSSAWAAKVMAGAWWVEAHQVSKSAPSGEYLPTGSFVVRGKKRPLPAGVRLELGLTFLFRLDEDGAAAHAGERAVRSGEGGGDEDEREAAPAGGGEPAASADASPPPPSAPSPSPPPPSASSPSPPPSSPSATFENEDEDGDALDAALAAPDPLAQPRQPPESEEEGVGGDSVAQPASPGPPPPPPAGRRKPTAAERRAMKKLGITDVADLPPGAVGGGGGGGGDAAASPPPAAADTKPPPPAQAAQRPPPPPPRGKRGKHKKARDKYAHQSDEERALVAAALGVPGSDAKSKAQRRAERKAGKQGGGSGGGGGGAAALAAAPPTAAELAAVGATGKVSRKPGGGGQPRPHKPTPGRALAGAVAALHLEDEEAGEGGVEVGGDDDDRDDDGGGGGGAAPGPDYLATVDALTGAPRPDDVLLQAVPMVAPYGALAGCALRVKLTPGTGKRGRVAAAGAALLARGAGVTHRMRELMRAVPAPELAAVVPGGGAKVSAPGAAKLAAEARRAAQRGKREKKGQGGQG